MTNKIISLIQFILAGIIFIGLISKWQFEIWRVVDILVIIILIIIGIILVQKESKITSILSFFKSKTFIFIIVIMGIVFLILGGIGLYVSRVKNEEKKCHFTLMNIKENRYQEDKDASLEYSKYVGSYTVPAKHYTYWEIDGMLVNNSNIRQSLRSIIAKIYTCDGNNILLTDGFKDVKAWLEPNQSYPFQVRAVFDRNNTTLSKYFSKDDEVRLDIYPFFTSCQ
jgi:hypothetical protein